MAYHAFDEKKKTVTIIVESGRCAWGKCAFCGFSKKKEYPPADTGRLASIVDGKLSAAAKGDVETLKFFNSGSFVDDCQIPQDFREWLFEKCGSLGIRNLVVEVRADQISEESLKKVSTKKVKVTLAIGLEVASDEVLRKLCKGITVKTFEKAAVLARKKGFRVRTYLLANPPFAGDPKKSLNESVKLALKLSDSVAIINSFPMKNTLLFEMWLKNEWRPLDRKEFEKLTKGFAEEKKIELYFDDYVFPPAFDDRPLIVGANEQNLTNPAYGVWQDYIQRFYEKPEIKDAVLFLPCSFRKPYSQSKTHQAILSRISKLFSYARIHQVMISNPGVIPREFENKYPFNSYDWPEWEETPEIKKRYIEVTAERLTKYLERHKYGKVFAYLKPDSESFTALSLACGSLKLKLISCADEREYEKLKQDKSKDFLIERTMLDGLMKKLRENLGR